MDASHYRDDRTCMPQVFEGNGHKTTLDNIPCKFYEEAPLTTEDPVLGRLKTMVWDVDYGGYVEQKEPCEPEDYKKRPFSKEYIELCEQLKNEKISLGDMLIKVLEIPIYADEE